MIGEWGRSVPRASHTPRRTLGWRDSRAGTGDTSCRASHWPGRQTVGTWAETNRPRLAWSRTRRRGGLFRLAGWRRSWLAHPPSPLPAVNRVDVLTGGPEQGLGFVFWV